MRATLLVLAVRWAIVWLLTAGAVLVFAYHTRDGTIGSRTIYWWLPVLVSLSLVLLRSSVVLLAQRGSPSFRGELPRLGGGVVDSPCGSTVWGGASPHRLRPGLKFAGRSPTVRVHEGTPPGSDDVRNWVVIGGEREGGRPDGARVSAEARFPLSSFRRGD